MYELEDTKLSTARRLKSWGVKLAPAAGLTSLSSRSPHPRVVPEMIEHEETDVDLTRTQMHSSRSSWELFREISL